VRPTIAFLVPLALGAACGAAFGAGSGVNASIEAKPHVAQYKETIGVHGHLGHRRGVVVSLERERLPFDSGFTTVARQRTRRHGAYHFHQVPPRATRYRVLAGDGSRGTGTVTAYVEPRFIRKRCNLCGASSHESGKRTLRISLQVVYPKESAALEGRKRVLLYYGQRNGSSKPPRRLHLVETARQERLAHHRTRVTIAHRVNLPKAYRFAVAVCTRTTMRTDGIGLPGAPGSHGCGDARISYRQSRHWLG
jgi:hypothetical protein